ncbi:MAG TPA: phage holin family protein [Sedimentibacter sp.]|nr:phage holin family protein [Sedimentibacter sp.]
MKDTINTLQLIFTAIGGYLGYILGGLDGFLYALIAFVVIDYITGLMAAIIEHKLSSEIGFKGIFKKVLIFTMVAIGNILDSKIIGDGSTIRTAVIFFYLSNEGISIIENSVIIGLPVPHKLKDILAQLNVDGDEKK